jgi:adenylate cyclase
VAASLGEVQVTKSDIFGEPVNVTSRIEGITPGDEIYFSGAVHLAINKAEVPAVEIGLQDLKGIPKPVRIFAIPRFAQNHLVPDPNAVQLQAQRFGYPFGGMHLSAIPVASVALQIQGGFRSNP